ncbi:MAG: DNA polymerase III subunit delta' [Croceibacterium sp.]
MTFVGHEGSWDQWRAALAGERMHHGWILAGKRGLGKGAFAVAAARELVAEAGVVQPKGLHPDVIVLTNLPKDDKAEKLRDEGKAYEVKRNIGVDQIRMVQHRLTTRPTLGSRRVVVIDSADDLEKAAANAILKSLEEPPAGTFFLLVAHRHGRLLPTIRSRCRLLPFAGLPDADMLSVLQREAPQADGSTCAAAIAAASGSPGAALEFVELDLGNLHSVMEAIVERGDPDLALRSKLTDAMGTRPDRKRQLAALELARAVLAGRMGRTEPAALPALAQSYADLVRLANQAPTYNYDPGLLVMEIGGLLASLGVPTAPAHG